jgi:CRP/FNR family transcriptional regulator, cyclic AMP receptor protein
MSLQEAPPRHVVAVLDRDADLARDIGSDQLAQARQASHASVLSLGTGPWAAEAESEPARGGFGLLVLEGLLVRDVGVDGRYGAEVLGPSDLLRPWDYDGNDPLVPVTATWRVIAPVRLAVLDARWAVRMSSWPSVGCELAGRGVMRSRRLVMMLAIAQQPRLDLRLWMLLWELAERYGTVHGDGVHLHAPLTHESLAHLASARRPSVSSALSRLIERGVLERRRSTWILRGGPPSEDGRS